MRRLEDAAAELAAAQAGRAAVADVEVSLEDGESVLILCELEDGEILVGGFPWPRGQRFDATEIVHAVADAMADRARLN